MGGLGRGRHGGGCGWPHNAPGAAGVHCLGCSATLSVVTYASLMQVALLALICNLKLLLHVLGGNITFRVIPAAVAMPRARDCTPSRGLCNGAATVVELPQSPGGAQHLVLAV